MKNNESSMTALISSFSRAYHEENDDPKIFSDNLAKQLMTAGEYEQISRYMAGGIDFFSPDKKEAFSTPAETLRWVVHTQLAPTPLARARFSEDALANAIQVGASQYVILGAGMDTFAYRNPDVLEHFHVFEVDHPATQAFKKQRVEQAGWGISDNLHYVPIDFSAGDLVAGLMKAGLDQHKLTFFSWLGVSYYLTKERFAALLKAISGIVPRGSSIVFDYADEFLFSSDVKRVQNMIAMAKASGEPMKSSFSYPELEKMLEDSGWLIYEHLTSDEIEERFFSGRNDYLHAFEHINYCLAVTR
ncbi:MAG: class I SAM-dependent methyltransferase [Bacillus sp. (in: firmicutes)]